MSAPETDDERFVPVQDPLVVIAMAAPTASSVPFAVRLAATRSEDDRIAARPGLAANTDRTD